MSKTFNYYKDRIVTGSDPEAVISEARKDYGLIINFDSKTIEYQGDAVPFNLEREYVCELIESKKFKKAEKHIEQMKKVYNLRVNRIDWLNFIEILEYHLSSAKNSKNIIRKELKIAKKEFNNHSITIISIIVGIITIFGTANQVFVIENFDQALKTFYTITGSVIVVIMIAFGLNNKK